MNHLASDCPVCIARSVCLSYSILYGLARAHLLLHFSSWSLQTWQQVLHLHHKRETGLCSHSVWQHEARFFLLRGMSELGQLEGTEYKYVTINRMPSQTCVYIVYGKLHMTHPVHMLSTYNCMNNQRTTSPCMNKKGSPRVTHCAGHGSANTRPHQLYRRSNWSVVSTVYGLWVVAQCETRLHAKHDCS